MTADKEQLEQKLIDEFHRMYPDAEKRPASLLNPEATAVIDLTAELIAEDELGQPLDPSRVRLTFTATNFADYNNDGAVNISDITPLAQRFGLEYDDTPMPGDLLSARHILGHPDTRHNRLVAGADGSGNGKVDIADITPLAVNFNSELAGYNLYRAEVVDSLLTFSSVPLPNLLEGTSSLSVSLAKWGDAEEQRTGMDAGVSGRFVITLETEAPPDGEVYGYRAQAWGEGEEGPNGNVTTVGTPAAVDTVPPYWIDTVGVTSTLALDEGVEVNWGAAYDNVTPPVHYRLYYSPGTELDWGTATVVDDVTPPYQVLGLTTLQPYTFAVRAYDSSPTNNLELNTVTRTEYPGPRDIYPPEWDYSEGCQAVVAAGDRFYVTWPRATDFHEENGDIFESNPVRYTIYYSTQYPLVIETANKVIVEGYDMPSLYTEIAGIVPGVRYYFLVRASDSAIIPNEDANTVVCSGKTHEIVSSVVASNSESFAYRYSQIFTEPSGIVGFYLLEDDSGSANYGVALHAFRQVGDQWVDELLFEPTEGRSIIEFSVARDAGGIYHLAVRAEDMFSSPILYYLTWDGQNLTTVTRDNGRYFSGVSIAFKGSIVGFAYTSPGAFPDASTYTYYMEYESGEWREELVYAGEGGLCVTGDSLAYDEDRNPVVFIYRGSVSSLILGKQGDNWQIVASDDDISPYHLSLGTLVKQDSMIYVGAGTLPSALYSVNAKGKFNREFSLPFYLNQYVTRSFRVLPPGHVVGAGSVSLRGPVDGTTAYVGSIISGSWLDLVNLGFSTNLLVPRDIRNLAIGGDGNLYYSYMRDRRYVGEDSILLKVDHILP